MTKKITRCKWAEGVSLDYIEYHDKEWGVPLTDEDGTIITDEQMEEQMNNGTFFPYFDDYTLHGVFPDMTRTKWIDLIWSE